MEEESREGGGGRAGEGKSSGIERERAAGMEQLGSKGHKRGKREREATAKPGAGRNVVSLEGEKRRERFGWNTKYSQGGSVSID